MKHLEIVCISLIYRLLLCLLKYYSYLPPRGCGESSTKKQTPVPAGIAQPIRVDDEGTEGGI